MSLLWLRYIAMPRNNWQIPVFSIPQGIYQIHGSKCLIQVIYCAWFVPWFHLYTLPSLSRPYWPHHRRCVVEFLICQHIVYSKKKKRLPSKLSVPKIKLHSLSLDLQAYGFKACFALAWFCFGFCFLHKSRLLSFFSLATVLKCPLHAKNILSTSYMPTTYKNYSKHLDSYKNKQMFISSFFHP